MSRAATAKKSPAESQQGGAASGSKPLTLPLSDEELNELFDRFKIPPAGRLRIQTIRREVPGRATQSTKKSGKVRYTSLKMGFVLEAEAFNTECVALTEWDHDASTRELYSQPACHLKLSYRSGKSGKMVSPYTTPDAFRITDEGFVFTECKTEDFLIAHLELQPERYVRGSDGTWTCPPGERAAEPLGCRFELRSTKQNNFVAFENLELLKDFYVSQKKLDVANEARQLLTQKFTGRQFVSAFELIHTEPRMSADDLYALLVLGEIYYPIDTLRLADQDSALFFRSRTAWEAHQIYSGCHDTDATRGSLHSELLANDIFTWNEVDYEILNPGEPITCRSLDGRRSLITLTASEFESLSGTQIRLRRPADPPGPSEWNARYQCASLADLQEATWRYELLFSKPSSGNKLTDRGERIRFVWLRDYRDAQERWGNGYLGLLPDRHGNRTPKADPKTIALAKEVIGNDWETIRRKKRMTSYGNYKNQAEGLAQEPISYATFCKFVKERSGHAQSVARDGEKAAYDLEPEFLELTRSTPRHGTHSWHIGHIDHTPLPLKFLGDKFEGLADTVWLSILTTGFDRKIRAYYLSFDEPSYRSNMMVLRDCVRRHGRVPQYIVSDGGPEFQSVYYETLLARLHCKKRERAKGKARFGSVCERLFGTTQSGFVSNLLGATELLEKHFRAISPEVEPKRWATWILDKFDTKFEEYLSDIYHPNNHSGIDMSPDAAEALSLKSHGTRPFARIPYDEQFIAETCPAVPRGTVKVCPQGVKINYRWHDGVLLHQPGVLGARLQGRYDPWNAGRGYVYLKGRWEEVRSECYVLFQGLTERAIRFATDAMRAIARKRGEKAIINAQSLAQFLQTTEAEEAISRQVRNDAEAAQHRTKVNSPSEPGRAPSKESPRLIPNSSTNNVVPFTAPKRATRLVEDL